MSKLKTLNDFRTLPGVEKSERRNIYNRSELQEAAREWYENVCFEDWFHSYSFKCLSCGHNEMEWNYEGNYRCCSCGSLYDPIQLWIKHFFNLEDE